VSPALVWAIFDTREAMLPKIACGEMWRRRKDGATSLKFESVLKSHARIRNPACGLGRMESLYVHVCCSLTVHFRPRCSVRTRNFLYAACLGALYGRVCISCHLKPPVALGSSLHFNPCFTEG
jgi:hypothetical protein